MGNNGNGNGGLHNWYVRAATANPGFVRLDQTERAKGKRWVIAGFFFLVVVLSLLIVLSGHKELFYLPNWPR